MRKLSVVALVVAAVFVIYLEASGWGRDGHSLINRTSVRHLPGSMLLFIQDSSFFQQHASDADVRRTGDTAFFSEQWRHFLDIDDYPNYQNLPRSLDTLIRLYGWERVKENGTNPWATLWFYDSLVAQLGHADWPAAKQTAADIGHYVGDAHQPLHVTKNYNGQLSGQSGIHSRYESTMLSATVLNSIAILPDSVSYIANRMEFIFDYLLLSNSYVDTVLQADLYAKSLSGGSTSSPAYYNALWSRTQRITVDEMQRATKAIASFWYSAWVDAGLISVTGVLPPVAATPVELSLAQNYPNPFNPATMISYSLPVGGTVSLKVFSVDGREIATLVQENQSAGSHAVQFSAPPSFASGVYLYQLRLGNFSQTKKFVLLK